MSWTEGPGLLTLRVPADRRDALLMAALAVLGVALAVAAAGITALVSRRA